MGIFTNAFLKKGGLSQFNSFVQFRDFIKSDFILCINSGIFILLHAKMNAGGGLRRFASSYSVLFNFAASSTASAVKIPSMAADMMPPA